MFTERAHISWFAIMLLLKPPTDHLQPGYVSCRVRALGLFLDTGGFQEAGKVPSPPSSSLALWPGQVASVPEPHCPLWAWHGEDAQPSKARAWRETLGPRGMSSPPRTEHSRGKTHCLRRRSRGTKWLRTPRWLRSPGARGSSAWRPPWLSAAWLRPWLPGSTRPLHAGCPRPPRRPLPRSGPWQWERPQGWTEKPPSGRRWSRCCSPVGAESERGQASATRQPLRLSQPWAGIPRMATVPGSWPGAPRPAPSPPGVQALTCLLRMLPGLGLSVWGGEPPACALGVGGWGAQTCPVALAPWSHSWQGLQKGRADSEQVCRGEKEARGWEGLNGQMGTPVLRTPHSGHRRWSGIFVVRHKRVQC